MKPVIIDPKAIKAGVAGKAARPGKATFGTVMDDALFGLSAMGPAIAEGVGQGFGSEGSVAVLNAAFSGIEGLRGAMAQSQTWGGTGGFGSYADAPGLFGVGRHTTTPGYVSKTASPGAMPGAGAPGGEIIPDSGVTQQELIQTMNANNLKLLELQALMQSNMQAWTTKSNILSADHRARMSMIEKFTARG